MAAAVVQVIEVLASRKSEPSQIAKRIVLASQRPVRTGLFDGTPLEVISNIKVLCGHTQSFTGISMQELAGKHLILLAFMRRRIGLVVATLRFHSALIQSLQTRDISTAIETLAQRSRITNHLSPSKTLFP